MGNYILYGTNTLCCDVDMGYGQFHENVNMGVNILK